MSVLLVIVGGAAGALLRWGLSLVGSAPWPTLAANVVGSLLLGVSVPAGPTWAVTLLGSGVAGSLTTYSTFALETVTLPRRTAAVHVSLSLVLGAAAFALGWVLAGGS